VIIRTLGTTPSSLSDIKSTAYRPGIYLAALLIHKLLFRLHHCARLPFVVDTQNLTPNFEFPPLARNRQRPEELKLALAVQGTFGVEFRDSSDWFGIGSRVEIYDVLILVLEGENDWIGREGSKFWVEFLCEEYVRFCTSECNNTDTRR
jgi:hypothetical protein